MMVIGSSGSGKSNFLKNLITKKDFGYKKIFKKNIFIFSPTSMADETFSSIKNIKEENIFDSLDKLEDLINEQKKIIADRGKKKSPHIWIIMDDCLGSKKLNNTYSNVVNQLFFKGRHYNISISLVSQVYKIPRSIRLNTNCIVIFNGLNQSEVLAIERESPVNFREMYKTRASTNYSFIYINNTKPLENRYYDSNFNKIKIKI